MADNDGDFTRKVADLIELQFQAVDLEDEHGRSIFGRACFMAGLKRLRSVMDETDVILILRETADQSEAVLMHAFKKTGQIHGKRDGRA